MTSAINIRPQDFKIVQNILSNNLPKSGCRIFVFGSRATATAKRASDLDLAIDLGRQMTRIESHTLANQFEDSDLPYRVDVIDLQTVSSDFLALIQDTLQELVLPA